MKPRTRIEKEVAEESRLRHLMGKSNLSERERRWILDNAFLGCFKRAGEKHIRCLKCGKLLKDTEKKCPCCGNVRKDVYCEARLSYMWVLVASSWKRWQVLTVFECVVRAGRDGANMTMCDIVENWVDENGKRTVMARGKMPMHYENYLWTTDMSIKRERKSYSYYGMGPDYTRYGIECPYGNINKEFKRRGFRMKRLGKINAVLLAEKLPGNTMLETVMKLGREDLAYGIMSERKVPGHCWRLALKYNYRPKNMNTWMDYIEQLEYLGMDTHNPKILLPDDLVGCHQEMTEKVNRKRKKEREKKEREECIRNLDRYREEKGKFLGIEFEGRGIRFHVLQSPEEFLDEGQKMHHCVAMYWSHKDCLILSARDEENRRLETVEVSLKSFDITQSQGPFNKPTDRHEDIKRVVMQNMKKIRECAMGKAV